MASEGSLAEPPPPPPAHPVCRRRGGGDTPLLLRVPVSPPRLSCACPGGGVGCPVPPPPHPTRAIGLCRCRTLGPPPATHGEFHPTEDGAPHEGPPQSRGSRGGAVPNGHLPGDAPGPEQELGARLRRLGDAFQQTYEQQRGGAGGVFWGHLYRLVSQLLGAVYNLQGRGGN